MPHEEGNAPHRPLDLTIRGVKTTAVEVPMTFPLGTSADKMASAPLLLVDIETDEGVTGSTYLFCYRRSGAVALAALIGDALDSVRGKSAVPLAVAEELARRFTLIGVTGVARMALAAIDGALWDCQARAAGLPLATLLGGKLRPIPAYNSSGLGLMPAGKAADEAEALIARGFRAVKLRLGHPSLTDDLAVTRAVRSRLPNNVAIFVDYNQALSLSEAQVRGHALNQEGVAWLEEPIRHDDLTGMARLTRELGLPVQTGENFNGVAEMASFLHAEACDLVMPDYARIGGVSGWLQAAAIAAAQNAPMSSHLFPEVSAHLLAATPTAHWLEYVDWADPILKDPITIEDGNALPSSSPGSGLVWDMAGVKRFLIN